MRQAQRMLDRLQVLRVQGDRGRRGWGRERAFSGWAFGASWMSGTTESMSARFSMSMVACPPAQGGMGVLGLVE